MYDGARVPSPQDSANGFSQPGGSTGRPKSDEESEKPEPVLVKRAHREILDHERKRRVELKCMELQEMMEEQGYPEDEIRQKVGTFRQMLMEKEGVLTREGSHSRQIVNHTPHSCEEERDDNDEDSLAEGYAPECDCHGDYYGDGDSVGHGNYRMKRKLSSSPSPPPKKRKKKKSGHRRSRFDSSSPPRKEKKKKSRKKHKRDRSASGSRKKRRYRSGSPKSKHKDKNKQRRRSPVDSPGRRSHRRGSCSSRSASISSTGSLSRSPGRTNSKHGADSHKPRPSQSSRSVSLSPSCGTNSSVRQNGHRNGKGSGPDHTAGDPLQDISVIPTSPSGRRPQSPQPEQRKVRNEGGGSPGRLTDATSGDEARRAVRRSTSVSSGKRGRRQKALGKSSHSPTHSSDSAHSQRSQVQNSRSSQSKKARGVHLSRRRRRSRPRARHRSSSASPGRHRRHGAARKKSSSRIFRQRSSSWSSARSASCSRSASRSRSPEHGSKAKSPYSRQNNSRDKDSAPPTDTEGRARRRSRTYSPIRKRRRDSPSFMEARRITRFPEDHRQRSAAGLPGKVTVVTVVVQQFSPPDAAMPDGYLQTASPDARKRPIPYYRPSPSSSSYPSSASASSRSYRVYSSYSRSRSRSHSYYSRSSSESAGF
ncbi:uncharacterized protein srrm3 isoform X2 [Paramormyrops kingsleyae]|uniref:uncharacterized protein srrm3 isoform X2 n=1 Tax=Paramormyrops kingsleyae TaxID=1676925 RepID=UPI000CD5E388|nr:serine/arginine repetitive matrix protein 3 isoform X2 [Paramormyrops kingsleyae]